VILMFIPFVNFITWIILCIDVAKSFGKGVGFAIGLILLPFIFFLILGFGSAQYQGPSASPGVAVSPPPQACLGHLQRGRVAAFAELQRAKGNHPSLI
jgi:Family of unknown function (DUF5684)